MSNATVDALGMCFSHIPLLVWLIASSDKSYIRIGESVHISAWASMLLVQQIRNQSYKGKYLLIIN